MTNTSIAGSPFQVLLVAEHGTDWSRWMDELADAGSALNAVMQSPNESLKDFARRIGTRVSTMSNQKRLAPTILFVTHAASEATDDASALLRRAIVDKLARHGSRVLVARDGAADLATAA